MREYRAEYHNTLKGGGVDGEASRLVATLEPFYMIFNLFHEGAVRFQHVAWDSIEKMKVGYIGHRK